MFSQKIFKWSKEDYSMREFVDIFSNRLPLIIFITEGWSGRDEDHTFSGDEIFRIAAVKRQRRIVAKHGSGYFVSIPTGINKKADLFFPDGKVMRSASMDDLMSALKIHNDESLRMMFENDEIISFTFGSDEGAEINFGEMRVVDVYDERYLVGHSVWHGQIYSPVLPRVIPVYMTLQVAPAIGLLEGTDEDYHKVLADIEEQMKVGITEVEDYDEIMLFPHDITGSDYEYIRPCTWAPGILSGASCKMELPGMTSSPAYPSLVGRSASLQTSARTNVYKLPPRRPTNKPLPPDPPAMDPPVEGRPHAVVTPVKRQEAPAIPTRASVTERSGGQPPQPRRIPTMHGAASVTHPSSPPSSPSSSAPPRPTHDITSRSEEHDDEGYTLEDDDPLYDDVSQSKSGPAPNATRSDEYQSLSDVPADIRTLTPEQLASCMRMLKIPEHCICAFREKDVDGDILVSIDEMILAEEFKFGRFDAIKMMKFAKEGYRRKVPQTNASKRSS